MNTDQFQRILWLKGGALGDFIVALPTLIALRRAYPQARLEAAGPPPWLPLATGWADKLTPLDSPRWAFLYESGVDPPAGFEPPDLAVILRPDPDGVAARALLSAGSGRVLHRHPSPAGSRHVIDDLSQVLNPLSIPVPDFPSFAFLQTPPSVDDAEMAKHNGPGRTEAQASSTYLWPGSAGSPAALAARLAGRPPVLLHPGSGGLRKRWPAQRFLQLAEWLERNNERPVIILGPAELDQGEEPFWREAGLPLVTAPPILELAWLVAGSKLFVGNDSGVSHLAAAAGCPTLALFGPTDPTVWAPRGPKARFLLAPPNPSGQRLMEAISVGDVLEVITDQMAGK